ncbi:MAG: VRR-NUC domain-containing protein [Gammaproteobacteria bacterium]
MQPELPEAYYLDNVIILFDHVESLYDDILEPAQLDFLHSFAALGDDARKLYIRLLNRNHHLFRLSKLVYREVESIDDAMRELEASRFLQIDPVIEHHERVGLFNKAELLASHPEPEDLRKLRRPALESHLLEQADKDFLSALAQSDCIIRVLQKDCYLLLQMLFFGNLNQSMTDFILRDLGLNQYESYSIGSANRPYNSTVDIQQHWLLHQLDSLLQQAAPDDTDTLATCFAAIPEEIDPGSALFRKSERIKYEVARQYERLNHHALALDHYRQCVLPPSRERIARLLNQQGEIENALELCQAIVADPYGNEELQFAQEFGARLVKRHKINNHIVFAQPAYSHSPKLFELKLPRQDSVEQAVVDHLLAQDTANQCYYLENSLFNGVLGLLTWDVVFAPVPGAFYHPFQSRPGDFYAHDFRHKRKALLAQLWSSISSNDEISNRVRLRWQEKHGLMNPLVNWQTLSLDIIELALARIDFAHWMSIFEHILRDLRNNRSGFPDLVLFPADGGYQLVEVKGPGDSLQKNQQRWMQFFFEHDIPHALARVRWDADA